MRRNAEYREIDTCIDEFIHCSVLKTSKDSSQLKTNTEYTRCVENITFGMSDFFNFLFLSPKICYPTATKTRKDVWIRCVSDKKLEKAYLLNVLL